MAGQTYTLSGGQQTIDCGAWSQLRFVNGNLGEGYVDVDGMGFYMDPQANFQTFCTGETIVEAFPANGYDIYAQQVQLGLPFEDILMGLAGLVCGALVARVFARRI